MDYRQGAEGFKMEQDTAVTLGKFDGFHSGHRELMKKIMGRPGLKSVVFQLTGRERPQILTEAESLRIAEQIGISCLINCPLVPEVAGMEPEAFVKEILVRQLRAKYIAVGADFRFGYQRRGDFTLLQQLQKSCGFTVEVLRKKQFGGRDVSSTYVREVLQEGQIETVNRLLGYPFLIAGQAGAGGYLPVEAYKLLPPEGFYAAEIKVKDEVFTGIIKIRQQSDDGQTFRGAETYLFDSDMALAGQTVEADVYKFLGSEGEFKSLSEQQDQISRFIEREKGIFSE